MIVKGLNKVPKLPNSEVHLVIGILDGVHLGHQVLIHAAIESAEKVGGLPAVLTFWPHPSTLFTPNSPKPMIMTPEAKNAFLEQMGIQLVVEQEFTRDLARIEAKDFINLLIGTFPGLKRIYVGDDFRFGRAKGGDADLLKSEGRRIGFDVTVFPRKEYHGEPISSTRIRLALADGNIKDAYAMLGREL